MYAEFQEIITHDLPLIYIAESPNHTLVTNNVRNAPDSIWGPLSPYDEVYLDD
ncbi:MAG TPA: hypothetical protein VK082_06725 [Paenalcaligenes sp.]|nr:hypothetical protein [Paenalcaligenes sp.]